MLRDTRYIMFGPGVSTMPSATAATPRTAPYVITTEGCQAPAGQSRANSRVLAAKR
jgi:hypothetical protein